MHRIEGEIITGIRAIEIGGEQRVVPFHSTPEFIIRNYDRIRLSSVGRLIVNDGVIAGDAGAMKFYYRLNKNEGLVVFMDIRTGKSSIPRSRYKRYCTAARFLYDLGMYPKCSPCSVAMKCHVRYPYLKRARKVKTTVDALLTDAIDFPDYLLDTKKHSEILRQVWADKRIKPVHLTIPQLSYLYGKEFLKEHPLFRPTSYRDFCKEIRTVFDAHANIRQMRIHNKPNPDVKYSNVLYCMKKKKWYWVDFD